MSDDGTHQSLLDFAAAVPQARVVQAERDGIYPNFNRCIRLAKGEFIYIATSDDTMAADCLEKMVAALDENPDCDLAHCPMRVIDEHGGPGLDWWSGNSLFAKSSADFINLRHKRIAPYDGILCLLGDNIYSSVTQLLIRRSLFDKVGLYKADWGSVGDFHWNLRAALAASTVHVPDTWGGWRMHPSQATAGVNLNSPQHQKKIDTMIEDVLGKLEQYVPSPDTRETIIRNASLAAELKNFLREQSARTNPAERRMFLIRQAMAGSRPAWARLAAMLPGRGSWSEAAPRAVNSWFAKPVLVPLP
jgi:hypothetical protein